jgi:branched-chain amino acid transport system ATP-binding protein
MLDVRDLMVFYENMVAINNVSVKCKENQILGIFGANSAGKSTLCYAISGIILDIAHKEEMAGGERITVLGDIEYKGSDITKDKPSKRSKKGIVLCPERRRIFPESNVLENLRIGGYLATSAQAKETLGYVFETFEPLKRLKKREGGFLSGGEQQMLAIGRALMAQPQLLLLDEPLLGLSPLIQINLVRSIKKINKDRGITTIVTEQYARPVLPIVNYAYILENGSAVLEGESAELMENPDVRAAYFGL